MKISKSLWYIGINLAYIIITVVLIFRDTGDLQRTYQTLNKGLKKSNIFLDYYNTLVKQAIFKEYANYKNPTNQKYKQSIIEADSLVSDFCLFIDSVSLKLSRELKINLESSNYKPLFSLEGYPLKRALFEPQNFKHLSYAGELENKINSLMKAFKSMCDNDPETLQNILLTLSYSKHKASLKNWSEFRFSEVNIFNINTTFSDLKFRAKASLLSIALYIHRKFGISCYFCYDRVSIGLTDLSTTVNDLIKAEVYIISCLPNYEAISLEEEGNKYFTQGGLISYISKPTSLGRQVINTKVQYKNKQNDSIGTFNASFRYQVLNRGIQLNCLNADYLYIDLENILKIKIPGVNPNLVQVNLKDRSSGIIKKISNYDYSIKLNNSSILSGYCDVNINAEKLSLIKRFKVLPLPLPKPILSGLENGEVDLQNLLNIDRLTIQNEEKIFDQNWEIIEFTIKRFSEDGRIEKAINIGYKFNSITKVFLKKSKPGELLCFNNIKVKCNGNTKYKILKPLVFTIK